MRGVQWGAVAGVASALAVIAGYLWGGEQLVWAVSAVEVLLVMAHVAWRFRAKAHVLVRPGRTADEGPSAAHCERCERARERLDGRPGSVGNAVGHQ